MRVKSYFDENNPQLWEDIELVPQPISTISTPLTYSIKAVTCFYKGSSNIKENIISEEELVYSTEEELEEKLTALLELLDQKEQKLVD